MKNSLRAAALALGLGLALAAAPTWAADAFDLITPAEAKAEAKAVADAPEAVLPRANPPSRSMNQPAIRVVSPAPAPATAGVAAPLRIEVAFKAAPGTRIVPSTFRVLYGLLKIDLTERLKKHATVSENGVVVDQARVPDGQHRLILQVADDQGNTAEQELRIRVGAAS